MLIFVGKPGRDDAIAVLGDHLLRIMSLVAEKTSCIQHKAVNGLRPS